MEEFILDFFNNNFLQSHAASHVAVIKPLHWAVKTNVLGSNTDTRKISAAFGWIQKLKLYKTWAELQMNCSQRNPPDQRWLPCCWHYKVHRPRAWTWGEHKEPHRAPRYNIRTTSVAHANGPSLNLVLSFLQLYLRFIAIVFRCCLTVKVHLLLTVKFKHHFFCFFFGA